MIHLKLAFSLCLLPLVSSVTVLLFLIGTKPSERATFEFLAQQLAVRGHQTITVKQILIPEEPALVKHKLHLVKEKTLKNLLPRDLYQAIEQIGDNMPWKDSYEVDEYLIPYYAAHNYSCYRTLNSDLMTNLRREQIDVAIVYSGNPCQLALMHVLNIPFIYFDVDDAKQRFDDKLTTRAD
ncbi:unnamed protein product [Gongylonema pulchrum]|uniref:Glucuronosyltransferase n=1 Tax=Gongylonema pulchrum TaxID=637853 RepID=A0A183EKK0_9BILA|nr:unnamed protein product [Gongylonema pulchrum]